MTADDKRDERTFLALGAGVLIGMVIFWSAGSCSGQRSEERVMQDLSTGRWCYVSPDVLTCADPHEDDELGEPDIYARGGAYQK